jgi:tRNA(Arg) A34 adenosine deaminase TadA
MPTLPHDEICMLAAIEESAKAAASGHMPFGGVVADADGTILVRGHNQHAEMEIVRQACVEMDTTLRTSCTLYTSTEPCVMCAGAIYWSRIGRVVYGCSSEELANYTGPGGFDIPIHDIYSLGRAGTRMIEVEGPFLNEKAMQVHMDSGVWSSTSTTDTS